MSQTVIQYVLSRLRDLGVTGVFWGSGRFRLSGVRRHHRRPGPPLDRLRQPAERELRGGRPRQVSDTFAGYRKGIAQPGDFVKDTPDLCATH